MNLLQTVVIDPYFVASADRDCCVHVSVERNGHVKEMKKNMDTLCKQNMYIYAHLSSL